MDFLATNWGKIYRIFYPLNPDKRTTPLCFTEVELKEYGRADFIGIDPDGKIIIVEVGKGGKKPASRINKD